VIAGRIRQREAIEHLTPSGGFGPVRLLRDNPEVEGGADAVEVIGPIFEADKRRRRLDIGVDGSVDDPGAAAANTP
jgi:hypothetical protein